MVSRAEPSADPTPEASPETTAEPTAEPVEIPIDFAALKEENPDVYAGLPYLVQKWIIRFCKVMRMTVII